MAGSFFRTFVAVEVPEGEVKERILQFQQTLNQTGAELKLVETENIHITLRFLGDTSMAMVERLKAEISKVQFKPFRVAFRGAGVFPDHRRISVVWIGIDEGNIGLVDLQGKVENSLRRLGMPPDPRGFSPHLTVARVRSGRNRDSLSKAVMESADSIFGGFEVGSFCLKQSTLTPKGPIYQTLQEVAASST